MSSYVSGFGQSGFDLDEGDDSAGDTNPIANADRPPTEDEILEREVEKDDPKELAPGLTKELESKLINIVLEFERESYPVWRFYNRDFFEAESFWKDIQMGYYDAETDMWRTPSLKDLAKTGETGQRFTFQTNLYRALGGSVVNVLGQKMPTTRFLATDFERESDILAAQGAAIVTPIIERNNRMGLLNAKAAYLLYTHGVFVGYTRYLEDSERFGWKEEPVTAMQKAVIKEAGYECMYCAAQTPAATSAQDSSQSSLTSPGQNPPPASPGGSCPNCGRPLSEIDFRPPEYADIPIEIDTKLVPRGQEVITLHGGLESRLPPWCSMMEDYPFLGLVNEVHVSSLRATYGKRAKNLQGGWGAGPYDTWDRFARLALFEPTVSYYGTSNQNLVTFKRYWLKPSAYYMLQATSDRETMLEIAPDGCYLAFADSQKLLDFRNERMSDHLRVCTAVEGAGAYTPALGSSVISVQKRFNTVMNFIMEWLEYAAAGAGTFINANVINYKALTQHRRAPGTFYPVRMAVGANIGNAIKESTPGQLPGQVMEHGSDLRQLAEFLAGAPPTVTGGTQQSLKPTTYLSDKDSALGRLYTAWMHLRIFWAEMMMLSVKEFARWRTADEKYTIAGPDGDAQGVLVRLEDLQGNFDAYPETNEQFPVLWQQMQQVFFQLLQSAATDPFLGEILSDLENVPFSKAMLSLPDLYVPGEADRLKQKHEIAILLQQKPTQIQTMDPQTGQPSIQTQPSLGIDTFEDNHAVHEETVKKWAVSSIGLKTRVENPMGYKNVIAHGLMHEQYRLGLQAQMQARVEQGAAQQGGDGGNGSKNGGSSQSGVRGGGGKKPSGGKSSPAPGQSDNPADPGGASPVQQSQEIAQNIQAQVSGAPQGQ